MTLILIIIYYLFVHLTHCTTIQLMTKQQVEALSGESVFKNIPDQIVLPVKERERESICVDTYLYTH